MNTISNLFQSLVFGIISFPLCWRLLIAKNGKFCVSFLNVEFNFFSWIITLHFFLFCLDSTRVEDIFGSIQHGDPRNSCDCVGVLFPFSCCWNLCFQKEFSSIAFFFSYLPAVDQKTERVMEWIELMWELFGIAINRLELIMGCEPHSEHWSKGVFEVLFPALMLYFLFFIDHNISSILTQAPKYNLIRSCAYHWDFFCLGLTIIPRWILGLSPGSGSISQAPLQTPTLGTRKTTQKHGVNHEVTIKT